MLFDMFKQEESPKPKLIQLKRDYQRAVKMFERAMAIHGINSDEANYWSNIADDIEDRIAKFK